MEEVESKSNRQWAALLSYFFKLDAREMDDDEYAYQIANLDYCIKKLGYVDSNKGHAGI